MSALKKILMMANQAEEENLLPEGYAECECLQSEGNCRLKTPHPGDGIVVESILQGVSHGSSYTVPFSVYKSQGGFSVYHYDKGWTLGSTIGFLPFYFEKVEMRLTFSSKAVSLSMNNTLNGCYSEKPQSRIGTNSYVPHNLYIFGSDTNANSFKGSIFSVKVYDLNGNMLSHYVPVLHLADATPGMYDLIREEFLTNVGTGKFTYKLK